MSDEGKRAFTLTAAHQPKGDEGYPQIGTTLPGGGSYEVGRALAAGGGVIVTDDGNKIEALANLSRLGDSPPLKEISLSQAEEHKKGSGGGRSSAKSGNGKDDH
jgi:hypothetical protein